MKSLLRLSRMAMFSLLLHGLAEAQGQPEIVEIEVEGNLRRVAESLILSTIGLSPGVELSMENVQIAVHDLWNLNVFEDIQVYREYVEGGVKLIIEVEEAPTLEGIRFKGQKQLKEKEMEEALGLIEGQVITATSVARGRQKVLDLYKDKGYLRAEVSGKRFAAEEEGKVFLQYDIKEREKVKIKRINILNSYALEGRKWWWPISRPSGWITSSEDQIKKQMETKEKKCVRNEDCRVCREATAKEREAEDFDPRALCSIYDAQCQAGQCYLPIRTATTMQSLYVGTLGGLDPQRHYKITLKKPGWKEEFYDVTAKDWSQQAIPGRDDSDRIFVKRFELQPDPNAPPEIRAEVEEYLKQKEEAAAAMMKEMEAWNASQGD